MRDFGLYLKLLSSLDQYEEITPQALALMNEGYGSYVIPKVDLIFFSVSFLYLRDI